MLHHRQTTGEYKYNGMTLKFHLQLWLTISSSAYIKKHSTWGSRASSSRGKHWGPSGFPPAERWPRAASSTCWPGPWPPGSVCPSPTPSWCHASSCQQCRIYGPPPASGPRYPPNWRLAPGTAKWLGTENHSLQLNSKSLLKTICSYIKIHGKAKIQFFITFISFS